MKLKYPVIAAFAAVLALTACGGGGDGAGPAKPTIPVSSPAALTKTDNVVGSGAEAVTGKTVTVTYTLWLYSESAADKKGGASLQSGSFPFKLGTGYVIAGFEQGVLGMKVGGKRTVLIPANLAYGAQGQAPHIPPNSGLVYEITLDKVE
ncbi:FKBP-type peptidyl-prolyl cis-trans isomerase [Massilia niastensis]|uniref:FKBP-type peptidyl-prolyl cis-trans isomerase n=1 Tax=Massilia niastensis TaxID=544911 RepID=UPI000378DC6D|nr:FKBP-type peptidyl-prolyl cis-trans isomerase [Massilia niastensis]